MLGFDEPGTPPIRGRVLGDLRSADLPIDDLYGALQCAWQIVPMGDPRPCHGMTRNDAMAAVRESIDHVRNDLRQRAAAIGADVVADIRCFAEARPARLWCEGIAKSATASAASEHDPAAPIEYAPRTPGARFTVLGDGSVGTLGKQVVVGTMLGIRYRPVELGLYILDLSRNSLAPKETGRVGLGGTALLRKALRRSRADALVGVSALATLQNGATNPSADSLYHGFLGFAYQSSWRISGVAQPFAQLRVGAARGSEIDKTLPMLELHLGLSTPERR